MTTHNTPKALDDLGLVHPTWTPGIDYVVEREPDGWPVSIVPLPDPAFYEMFSPDPVWSVRQADDGTDRTHRPACTDEGCEGECVDELHALALRLRERVAGPPCELTESDPGQPWPARTWEDDTA